MTENYNDLFDQKKPCPCGGTVHRGRFKDNEKKWIYWCDKCKKATTVEDILDEIIQDMEGFNDPPKKRSVFDDWEW